MSELWMPIADDPRFSVPTPRGELETLEQYLRHYRLTLEMKCDGLDAEQLGRRSVPPSTMSLLGLVRHLARVEHHWFRRVIEGRADLPRLFADPAEDTGFGFDEATDELVRQSWDLWRTEVAHAEVVLGSLTSLDQLVEINGESGEARDVVVHMIEEYARHVGHADLLRECIDGRTGQ